MHLFSRRDGANMWAFPAAGASPRPTAKFGISQDNSSLLPPNSTLVEGRLDAKALPPGELSAKLTERVRGVVPFLYRKEKEPKEAGPGKTQCSSPRTPIYPNLQACILNLHVLCRVNRVALSHPSGALPRFAHARLAAMVDGISSGGSKP